MITTASLKRAVEISRGHTPTNQRGANMSIVIVLVIVLVAVKLLS